MDVNEEAVKYLNMLSSNQELGYDVETNGLRWQTCNVCGYGISDGRESYYVPTRHAGGNNISNVEAFEKQVSHIISERTAPLIAHNAKFDMHMSQNHGIYINKVVDTMTMGAILNENRRSFSLKNLCKEHPDIVQKNDNEIYKYLADLFGCKPDASSMGHYYKLSGTDDIGVEYAKADNIAVKQLYEKQRKQLYAEELEVVQTLECDLTPVLQQMERRGVKIDIEALALLKEEIGKLQYEAYQRIPMGEDLSPLNVKSSKDLEVYFEYLNILDYPITEKGNPSFPKAYLATVPQAEIILEARKLDTLVNMFLEPIDGHIFNQRVHTNFNQAIGELGGTTAGRLSSNNPNMQQIPKRDKFIGKKFRKVFIADKDFMIVELDYSQMHPRLFTHYSKEPVLIEGYNASPYIDMHSIATKLMEEDQKHFATGKFESLEDAFDAARSKCKNLNLGIMYTMGAKKLAAQLGITYNEALFMFKLWHRTFPEMSNFTRKAEKVAQYRGYVKSLLGRRARFPDPEKAYRAANRIILGGESDIFKWKIIEIDRWIKKEKLEDVVQMLLNIHDSLVFQIHKDYLHYIPKIEAIMTNVKVAPFNLIVPFAVEYKPPGVNWSLASYGPEKTEQKLAA